MHIDIKIYNQNQELPKRTICDLLAEEIQKALPNSECKVWHGAPVWFIDDNPIAGYSTMKDGVRLLFWSGQSFETRGLTPEGSFKAAEARYTDVDQVDLALLQKWLKESIDVQWDYKNIIKRRGKLERL